MSTIQAISHLLAASIGASLGYLICAMIMAGELSDLERENAELRNQLNASSFFGKESK